MNNLFQTVKKPCQSNICLYDTLEKNYFTNNLEEQPQHEQATNNDVEIIPPPIRTPTISIASTKGRKGSQGRKRGRPEKVDNTHKTATPTVID
jgi:hypothetical protein